jgi:hypothetical protein
MTGTLTLLGIIGVLVAQSSHGLAQTQYTYKVIKDLGENVAALEPSINNSGQVAFTTSDATGNAVHRGDGGAPAVALYSSGGEFG